MRITLLCLLIALAVGAAGRAAGPAGQLIDHVWAGHPVSFALLTERGHQFIAYYDAERRITVAGRKLGEEKWTTVRPAGVPVPGQKRDSNVTNWDTHNTLRLALDRDGCLHLSGNMHVNPLVYYRTHVPFDVTTLERIDRMIGERETRCTYPLFFKTAAGDLVFRYRDGSSGNGSDLYNIYDQATRTWRRLLDTPLLEGEGQRNAYATEPKLGPDGYFHLVWMWRETPDASTNHTLSYARSRDLVHWENSRGEVIKLPITLATSDVIDPAKEKEGLINMTMALGFDAQERPIVTYHRYDAAGKSQIFAARPGAKRGWEVRPVSNWDFRWQFGGGGSLPAEISAGAPRLEKDGTLTMNYATMSHGSGRWQLRADTLERIAELPAPPPTLPEALRRVRSDYPGMEVQSLESRAGGKRWMLRWETLGRNRDLARDVAPPPSELWLYELPDVETNDATRVGS